MMSKKMKEFCTKKQKDNDYYNTIKYTRINLLYTVLLGPNGCGKSTTLKSIEHDLKKKGIKVVKYSTSHDDVVTKKSSPFDFQPEYMIAAFYSEGERMDVSFNTWASEVMVPKILEDSEPIYILLDEIDSGLSIDRILACTRDIRVVGDSERAKGRDIHFIITANSYELAESFKEAQTEYIWIPTGEDMKLCAYSSFKGKYIEYFEEMFKDD